MSVLHENADQFDLFFYTADETKCEDLTKYKIGGLHPILLGDILPKPTTCTSNPDKRPRYRIVLKLGFGAFSTVWLARDLTERRYVALKVCQGSDQTRSSKETCTLSRLHDIGRPRDFRQIAVKLFDAFIITGPNGLHDCIVTEVVASLGDPDVRRHCSSDAMRQIVEGFTNLHGQGIIHGDPHPGNFGVALPQLERFSEDDLVEYFPDQELIPVVPRDSSFPVHSLPSYLVVSSSLVGFLESMNSFPTGGDVSIRLLDFGRAHREVDENPVLPGAAPLIIRPPEVVVHELSNGESGSVWGKAADVWAVGSTLYHLRSGNDLISTQGSINDYFLEAIQYGGPPPAAWPKFWTTPHQPEDSTIQPSRERVWQEREATSDRLTLAHNENRAAFFQMLKGVIVTDPSERSSMEELLSHPFFGTKPTMSG